VRREISRKSWSEPARGISLEARGLPGSLAGPLAFTGGAANGAFIRPLDHYLAMAARWSTFVVPPNVTLRCAPHRRELMPNT